MDLCAECVSIFGFVVKKNLVLAKVGGGGGGDGVGLVEIEKNLINNKPTVDERLRDLEQIFIIRFRRYSKNFFRKFITLAGKRARKFFKILRESVEKFCEKKKLCGNRCNRRQFYPCSESCLSIGRNRKNFVIDNY